MKRPAEDLHGVFWRLVDVREMRECWLWKGALQNGSGTFSFRGHQYAAHRVAWSFAYGEIARGKLVLHACDVAACVNPRHLRLGTSEENNLDKSVLSRVREELRTIDIVDAERERKERNRRAAWARAKRATLIPGGPDGLHYRYTEIEPLKKQVASILARKSPMTETGVKYVRDLYRIHGVDFRTIAQVCRLPEWRVTTILCRTTWRHLP